MDLILRDKNFLKKRVIKRPMFECSTGLYGASANDFELTLPITDLLEIGDIVSYGSSEFGGMIRERLFDNKEKTVKYVGKTFRGQLESSIVAPFSTLTISGTDFDVVNKLIELSELSDVYKVKPTYRSEEKTLIFSAGTNALKAIDIVLNNFGEKAMFGISSSSESPCIEIGLEKNSTKKFDASQTNSIIDDNKLLITAIHASNDKYSASVYLQKDGTVSTSRYYTGFEALEICENISSKSKAELVSLAADRLLALRASENASEVDVVLEDADVGDIVKVSVDELGVEIFQVVNEKNISIQKNNISLNFKTGGNSDVD